MKIRLPKFHCLRCGHQWSPRNEEKPLRCAYCKSPYWEKASTREVPQMGRHGEECVGCRSKKE